MKRVPSESRFPCRLCISTVVQAALTHKSQTSYCKASRRSRLAVVGALFYTHETLLGPLACEQQSVARLL
eukprot:6178156-Pleurochrysis_carterae.AAC.1